MIAIYVITEGRYSDFGITAMFSTKEMAKAFISDNPTNRYNDIEEWILDEKQHYTTKTVWHCEILMKTGEICGERTFTQSGGKRHTFVTGNAYRVWGHSSVSRDHARKLVTEKYQEHLRMEALRAQATNVGEEKDG